MGEQYLTMAEIEAKYPNEWVLVNLPNPNNLRPDLVTRGHVVVHTRDRAEIDRKLLSLKDGELLNCAVQFNGPPVLEDELPAGEILPERAG